jgi:hypothetical protein
MSFFRSHGVDISGDGYEVRFYVAAGMRDSESSGIG